MSLRAKLLLGYAVFIAALVLLGGWSAWHIRAMGQVAQRILADNYESVLMAQEMKESLERQDSAALFTLLGEDARARTQLHEHRQRFDAAFGRAAQNITEPGEPEVIEAIRRERDAYYALFDAFLTEGGRLSGEAGVDVAAPAALARRTSAYFTRLAPAFDRLRAHCDHLLHVNQGAMLAKAEAAAGVAQRGIVKLLGMIWSPGNSRYFPDAISADPPLRQPALSLRFRPNSRSGFASLRGTPTRTADGAWGESGGQ